MPAHLGRSVVHSYKRVGELSAKWSAMPKAMESRTHVADEQAAEICAQDSLVQLGLTLERLLKGREHYGRQHADDEHACRAAKVSSAARPPKAEALQLTRSHSTGDENSLRTSLNTPGSVSKPSRSKIGVQELIRGEDSEGSSAEQSGRLQQAKHEAVKGRVRDKHVVGKKCEIW